MKRDPKPLSRYTPGERVNHWLVTLTFFLSALSGLVFFHPFFYPLSQLFGGGTWSRILHPFFGVTMALFFLGMFFRFWKDCLLTAADRQWLGQVRDLVNNQEEKLPDSGKLNGGQKLLFWLLALCVLLLLLSGIVIWRPYFADGFSVGLIHLAAVVHAASGFVLIALIIGHIYLAIWTRESIGAMLTGKVRRAWARQHHADWYREQTGGKK